MEQFRIPDCNWDEVQQRVDRLARRATKLGFPPPALQVLGHEDVPLVRDFDDLYGRGWVERERPGARAEDIVCYRRYYTVGLTGEAPVLSGYALVAVIEHGDSEVGNVIRAAPGQECPARYRQAPPDCQHCGTARRRSETFVLRGPDGTVQIGRNCLADYLRSPQAAAELCAYAQNVSSLRNLCAGAQDEEFFGSGHRQAQRAATERVLAVTARVVRHQGWCSRSLSRELAERGEHREATANVIEAAFFDRKFWEKGRNVALQAAVRDVQDEDRTLAQAALDWVRSLRGLDELADYLYNLTVVLAEDTVERKHFGLACSALAAHRRHLDGERERQERASRPQSRHVGAVGERGRFPARYLGSSVLAGTSWRGQDEARYVHRFLLRGQDRAVWWTGCPLELPEDCEVLLLGTIKEHGEYRGNLQTVLTRCSVCPAEQLGRCPHCGATVAPWDLGKNCPSCRKRGAKVKEDWFVTNSIQSAQREGAGGPELSHLAH